MGPLDGAVKILRALCRVPKHGHASHATRCKPRAVCEGSQLQRKRKPRHRSGAPREAGPESHTDPGAFGQRGHEFVSRAFCLGNVMGGTDHIVYTLKHLSVEATDNFQDCTESSHESPKRI